jgi:hypothetical protein
MIHPPLPGTVVGQPLLLAFRDSGPEVDVGRGVGVRLNGAGPAADTPQVLIGLTHRWSRTPFADRLDKTLGSLSAM